MGSKTKYYTELQVNSMFDAGDNLWGHELARVAAAANTMNPAYIMPTIINDANQFYNERVFDKMGVTANVTMSIGKLTKDGIGAYINMNIDPTIREVQEWFYVDENSVQVDSTILQVYDYIEEFYKHLGDYSNTIWQTLNGDTYEIEFLPYDIGGVAHTMRKRIYSDKEIPDTEIVSDIYGVWMSPIVDDVPDHANAVHIKIPVDERSVIAVFYETTNDESEYIFIFENEVTDSSNSMSALIIPFYKNKNPVSDSRELDFILNRFGLGAKDEDGDSLKESMADSPDLKHAFISYSMDRNDSRYGHWVDFIYGKPDGDEEEECEAEYDWMCPNPTRNNTPSRVDINGDYQISYSMGGGNPYGGYNQSYMITIERETKNADEAYFYIIPVEMLRKQILPDKFEAYKRMFNMFIYAEKKVKVKWYQTTFFRILFMIVGLVFGVVMGVISITAALVSVAVSVLAAIDPRLAAVLGIVIAIITFNPANIVGSVLNVANSMIRAYSSFAQFAFTESMNAISGQIEDINEDTKEMREQLSEMWHEGIYVPLDTMDNMMTMMMDGGETFNEMMYNQSDMIELAMENMLNPNARLT